MLGNYINLKYVIRIKTVTPIMLLLIKKNMGKKVLGFGVSISTGEII